MKSFLGFLFLLLIPALQAQNNKLNNALKMRMQSEPEGTERHTVLVKGNIGLLKKNEFRFSYSFNYAAADFASITCELKTIAALLDNQLISYAEFTEPRKQLMNDTMVRRNRISAVKAGQSPLAQAYDGTGVLIGIIDTGVDFTHPDLKDSQGNTRIRFLWDQVPTLGSTVPQPFNYGIEWTDTQINANQCTHSDAPNFGHGSHVTGVAAGNGLGNGKNAGVAPGADIIVVALNFSKPAPVTADAVQYIFIKATLLGKACVINASIGDYYGSHDATDLEALMIESMVSNLPGRAMVAAAGNAGSVRFHVKTQPPSLDTSFTWLKNNSNVLDYWCYGDTLQIKNLQFSVGANRSNYSDLGRVTFKNYNYALNSIKTDTLKHNNQRIGIIKSSAAINPSGVFELYYEITSDSSNLLWRVETKGQGLHHAWNFDFVGTGLPNSSQFPAISTYLKPDTLLSMVSGFQNSDEIITVANYNNLRFYYDVNNTFQDNGTIAGEINGGSSLGPTRDGRQKPDIAATGNFVFSTTALSIVPNLITNAPQVVAQGSLHVRGGGTSVSSPVVAGLGALYFQKNPTATNKQLKLAITNCAYQDGFTGTALPDYQWGYGKLDGKNAMLCGDNLVNIRASSSAKNGNVFPNPFHDKVNLVFDHNIQQGLLQVYNSAGQLLFEKTVSGNNFMLDEDIIGRATGLLLVNVSCSDYNETFKLLRD